MKEKLANKYMWAFSGIVILLYIGIAYVRMHANGVSFLYAFVTQSYILMGSLYLLSMILELAFVLFLPLFAQKLHDNVMEKVRNEFVFGLPFFYGGIAIECMSTTGQQHLLFKALESTEMSSNLRQSQQEN